MEYAACHVIYLDKRAKADRLERPSHGPPTHEMGSQLGRIHSILASEPEEVRENIKTLVSVFNIGKTIHT